MFSFLFLVGNEAWLVGAGGTGSPDTWVLSPLWGVEPGGMAIQVLSWICDENGAWLLTVAGKDAGSLDSLGGKWGLRGTGSRDARVLSRLRSGYLGQVEVGSPGT